MDKYIDPVSSDPVVRHQLREYVECSANVEVMMEDTEQHSLKSVYVQ